MRIHDLKIQRQHFIDVESGQKKAEIRKHDRDFNVGDFLQLNEIDEHGTATGEGLRVRVTHILPGGAYGLDADYSILSIERIARTRVMDIQPEPVLNPLTIIPVWSEADEICHLLAQLRAKVRKEDKQ